MITNPHHRQVPAASAPRLLGILLTVALTGCGGGQPTAPAPSPSVAATSAPAATASPSESSSEVTATGAAINDLIDIGGRSLYVQCEGSVGPTVLLEAGLGGDLRTWEGVVPDLPSDTRVCAYDRANTGRSDPAPTPRSARDAVDDLDALLEAIAEPAPYVLIGFSFGGIVTQLFAATHTDQVAGLVLVESNHPDEARQFEANLTADQIAADREETQANPEGIDVFESLGQADAAGSPPSVPLVVVTATRGDGWPSGWDPAVFDRLRSEQQADLVGLVPGGQQVFAEGSGHDIPRERPDVVVEAITQVLSGSAAEASS